jgi:hypothetical protein
MVVCGGLDIEFNNRLLKGSHRMPLTIEYLKKSKRLKPHQIKGLFWIQPPLKLKPILDGVHMLSRHQIFKKGRTVTANQFDESVDYPGKIHLDIGFWWSPEAFEVCE